MYPLLLPELLQALDWSAGAAGPGPDGEPTLPASGDDVSFDWQLAALPPGNHAFDWQLAGSPPLQQTVSHSAFSPLGRQRPDLCVLRSSR